jgi:hypothetical protein
MSLETDRDVPKTRGGKVRLRSLSDLDGRTVAAKRAAELVAELVRDLGGREQLSAALWELVKRVAVCGALAEDAEVGWLQDGKIDVNDYTRIINAQRRLLATIGIERRAKTIVPTLSEYLEAKKVVPNEDTVE